MTNLNPPDQIPVISWKYSQVSYDISKPKTRRRELDALVVAADELKCENLTLITWNTDETVNHKGKDITVVSVRSWFLNIAHN